MSDITPAKTARIRVGDITAGDIGAKGYAEVQRLALRRGRSKEKQIVWLVIWALIRSRAGDDVEPSDEQLDDLLDEETRPARVALAAV